MGVTQAVPRGQARTPDRLAHSYDLALAGVALTLIALGLVMVASASISIADRDFGQPFFYFWRQSAFLCVGLVLGLVCSH